MTNFKKAKYNGLIKHFTSAAIIKKENKYFLIDRKKKPFGWAPIAGHVDEGENAKQALIREVKEESNWKVKSFRLILKKNLKFGCRRIGSYHEISVYDCKVNGKLKLQKAEIKNSGWFTVEEMRKIRIEPLWRYLFRRLKILE